MPTLPLPRPGLPRRPARPSAAPDEAPPYIEPVPVECAGVRWYHIDRPRQAAREWLTKRFGFHPLAIEDVASRNQRPKLDTYDEYLFLVMHFPVYDKPTGRLLTSELDLFVGPDYVITLPNEPLPPLSAMFERLGAREDLREQVMGKGSGYLLYRIVDQCVDASFPMLRKTGAKLERLEDSIFEGRSAQIVRDLSNTKQEIINFRKIVRPQRAVLADLERAKQRFLAEELEVYFDDISDAAERIWDILENYKEVSEGLESTNESVLSHKLSGSLRVLTAASVILLPLTLVASIWGMNVRVPGEGDPVAFYLVLALMAVMLVSLVAFFRRREWL